MPRGIPIREAKKEKQVIRYNIQTGWGSSVIDNDWLANAGVFAIPEDNIVLGDWANGIKDSGSQLSDYATQTDLNDYVTLDTSQEITGIKTLSYAGVFQIWNEIGHADDDGWLRRWVNDAWALRIDRNTAAAWNFATYDRDFVIDKDGNVSFGQSPAAGYFMTVAWSTVIKTDWSTSLELRNWASFDSRLLFSDGTTRWQIHYDNFNNPNSETLNIENAATEQVMTFLQNSRVGIWHNNPEYSKLYLKSPERTTVYSAATVSSWADMTIWNPTDTNWAATGIRFLVDATDANSTWAGIACVKTVAWANQYALAFLVDGPSSIYEWMRLTSDWRLWIWLTDPQAPLHVWGSAILNRFTFTTNGFWSDTTFVTTSPTSPSARWYIDSENASWTPTDSIIYLRAADNSTPIILNSSGVSSFTKWANIYWLAVNSAYDGWTVNGNGIFMWQNWTSNWKIYMAQSWAWKSASWWTAVAWHVFGEHAIRFRVADDADKGFIFENSNEDLLMSIDWANGSGFFWGALLINAESLSAAKLHVNWPSGSPFWPHVLLEVDWDRYPIMQLLWHQHDSQWIVFDGWWDGSWKSSDIGSNFWIQKNVDRLKIRYDTGRAQWWNIPWKTALVVSATDWYIGINEDNPSERLSVQGWGIRQWSSSSANSWNNWNYFGANVANSTPKNYNGIIMWWNQSSGWGESIIGYSKLAGTAHRLDFISWDGATFQREMRLVAGSLWIGLWNTNPGRRLEVADDMRISGSNGLLEIGTNDGTTHKLRFGAASDAVNLRRAANSLYIETYDDIFIQRRASTKLHYRWSTDTWGFWLINPTSKIHLYQNNSEVGSGAGITIEQDGSGDSVIQFLLTWIRRWVAGIDNSDNDKFKISPTSDVGSWAAIEIDTSLNTKFNGWLYIRNSWLEWANWDTWFSVTANLNYSWGWKYYENKYGTRFTLRNDTWDFVWYTAPLNSWWAGSAATITEKMRLKNNGTLNISSLPTSSTWLSSWDLWNDWGTVKIV